MPSVRFEKYLQSVTGASPRAKAETPVAYLTRLMIALNGVTDAQYEALPESVREWFFAGVAANQANKTIPSLPDDATLPEEFDEDHALSVRNLSAQPEEEATAEASVDGVAEAEPEPEAPKPAPVAKVAPPAPKAPTVPTAPKAPTSPTITKAPVAAPPVAKPPTVPAVQSAPTKPAPTVPTAPTSPKVQIPASAKPPELKPLPPTNVKAPLSPEPRPKQQPSVQEAPLPSAGPAKGSDSARPMGVQRRIIQLFVESPTRTKADYESVLAVEGYRLTASTVSNVLDFMQIVHRVMCDMNKWPA